MDPLVRGALGIGDVPWPPDYATLLGLNPAEASADEVEAAVLERMERLRQYQIRFPEPVTEAMNLLARALDDLTSPATAVPLPAIEENAPLTMERPVEIESPAKAPPPLTVDPGVGVFAPPTPAKVFAVSARRARAPRRAATTPPLKPYVKPTPWAAPLDSRRRRVYELVRLHKLLQAWDEIGLLWSGQRLTRADLIGVVVALRRSARLGDLIPKEAGQLMLVWARSHPGTQALVDLKESRRQALATDWHAAYGLLHDRHDSARELSIWRRRWRRHGAYWVAVGLLVVALFVALIRALPRD